MPNMQHPPEKWNFAAFGLNVSADEQDNGFCRLDDGSVSVWSLNNRGKLNLPSTDGIAFYYTAVPAEKSFTLTVRVEVTSWSFTNGQEGFGIVAMDRVGRHGDDRSFWNNSYMTACTRVEYRTDPETGTVVEDSTYPLISMKLGIGAQAKTGVTPDLLPALDAGDREALRKTSSVMVPLEFSCAERGKGVYNLFANETSGNAPGTIDKPLEEVILRLEKTASWVEASYLDPSGSLIGTKRFYDPGALMQLDPGHVYVGLFAARSCRVTFRDIRFEVTESGEHGTEATPDIQRVVPTCRILSSCISNHAVYFLRLVTNADGTVYVTGQGQNGTEIAVQAMNPAVCRVILNPGENHLKIRFEPSRDFRLIDAVRTLVVVDRPLIRSFSVVLKPPEAGKTIYAAPDGTPSGDGTRGSPVDIDTAVHDALPGTEIILLGGVYRPGRKILVERDISGAPGKVIHMHAEEGQRALFDFEKKSAGFVFAGSYWEIEGIDCLNSAAFTPGIVLCGHDICLHHSRAFGNGDVGIVIWTLQETDTRDEWPHDIQVISCISCNNADPGATNADGFAAKITAGPGIVFDRCISCYNADDGWDLFAKVEFGPIGPIVIKNCISFGNGFDPSGQRRGFGNGFKLGGTSLPGGHFLYNCAAWGNSGKGIDANSAPDGHIKACTAFDNQGPNVALFTTDAAYTDYAVYGVTSCRRTNPQVSDILQTRGQQATGDLFTRETFYWMDGHGVNAEGLHLDPSWFASLDAPWPSPDALSGLMDEEGNLQLGQFLKLTDAAEMRLIANGIDPRCIAAHLHGSAQ